MKKFFALLFILTGCATTSHLTLDGVRDQFVKEAKDRDVTVHPETVVLVFVPDLPGTAAGRCFFNQSPRRIEISSKFWNDSFYADATRRQIVYHELGHCLLGIRKHVPNLAVNVYGSKQSYVSIMEKEPIPYDYYYSQEPEWLDRLFGRDLRSAFSE